MPTNSRTPKLLGDFGEGLATYLLIRKGFEVAMVDHVGADLIAERNGNRYAISVKTRRYKKESRETKGTVFTYDHIEKVEFFANRFGMIPALVHIVAINDDNTIHVFLMKTEDMKNNFDKVQHGLRIRFSKKH